MNYIRAQSGFEENSLNLWLYLIPLFRITLLIKMNNFLVIADDFTGANDTGVQIRRRGMPVRVVFSGKDIHPESSLRISPGALSWVLDTESRFLSEESASSKIISETEKISFGDYKHVVKKVDSTLRGNIGKETRALAQCYEPELIIFAPAFPDLGRTTVSGIHCLNGIPLCQTELAKDPKTPVLIDNVHEIMTRAFDEEVIHAGLDALRRNTVDFEKGRIFAFDAETGEDLKAIAGIVLASGRRVLWVGSAGLVDGLLGAADRIPPALAVVASVSSVTRGQLLFAERLGIALVKVPLCAILEKTASPGIIAEEAIALLIKGRDVILFSSSAYSNDEFRRAEECARRAGLSAEAMSMFTQETMGQIAVLILEKARISGLFLSGGDTAMSCIEKAGAKGTEIETEIAAGIPLMRLLGGKHEGLKVVTKAGAFGNEDAIYYSLRKLREG